MYTCVIVVLVISLVGSNNGSRDGGVRRGGLRDGSGGVGGSGDGSGGDGSGSGGGVGSAGNWQIRGTAVLSSFRHGARTGLTLSFLTRSHYLFCR